MARTDRRSPRRGTPPARWPDEAVPIDTGTAQVVVRADDPTGATLMVNGVPSSFLDLADPSRLEFEYQQQMAALVGALPPGPLRVLHLGAGACGLAMALDAARPGSHQVAVEIDVRLVELVRTWFDLPRPPRLRLRTGDARARLEATGDASTDVVVRDAFDGDRVPPHLCTVEAAAAVGRVLRPGGIYLANCADRPPLPLARREAATLSQVFAHVAIVAEPAVLRGRRYGNVVLAATNTPGLLDAPGVERALRGAPIPARLVVGDALRDFVAGALVLTDGQGAAGDRQVHAVDARPEPGRTSGPSRQ
ncbi:MAG: fused MFS/spermidine synthase [Actinobacteria bacterium]|nr:fused MFS/spermidine synthase [Actinomycetota bacterium]MCG2802304.1 fused MFS/spermidine synthase [Cellulomonas sp.]